MVPASPFNFAIHGANAHLCFKPGAAETRPSVSVLLLSFRCPTEAALPERSKDHSEAKKDKSGSCFPLAQSKPWTLNPALKPYAISITA